MDDSPIDFNALWGLARQLRGLDTDSFHGPAHWRRVERNGLWLAGRTGAGVDADHLFAILRETRRWDEGEDPDHGYRAAEYVQEPHSKAFHLDAACRALPEEAVSADKIG